MKIETWTKCKHCGAEYGLHHFETDQCPFGGREAPIGQEQIWKSQTFEPEVEEFHDQIIYTGQVYLQPILCADGHWRWCVQTFEVVDENTPALIWAATAERLFEATDKTEHPELYEE